MLFRHEMIPHMHPRVNMKLFGVYNTSIRYLGECHGVCQLREEKGIPLVYSVKKYGQPRPEIIPGDDAEFVACDKIFRIEVFDFAAGVDEQIDVAVRAPVPGAESGKIDIGDVNDPQVREIHTAESFRMARCPENLHPGFPEIKYVAPRVFRVDAGSGKPQFVVVLGRIRAMLGGGVRYA